MTRAELRRLYEATLLEEIAKRELSSDERRSLSHLLSASRRIEPGELREADHPNVWLWSDLHLGHAMSISIFGRPYTAPEDMDDALFDAWRRLVDPSDAIIVLGDVAMGGLSGRRLKRWRQAPGHKILVLGNHEFNGTAAGHVDGFDEIHSSVYIGGCPELLLTHLPLRSVPEGCVNVHGHVHKWAPSASRHINMVVEQVRYRPRSLTRVRRLAAELAQGARVPGRTTAQQLSHVG